MGAKVQIGNRTYTCAIHTDNVPMPDETCESCTLIGMWAMRHISKIRRKDFLTTAAVLRRYGRMTRGRT